MNNKIKTLPIQIKKKIIKYLLTDSQKIFYNQWELLTNKGFIDATHDIHIILELDYHIKEKKLRTFVPYTIDIEQIKWERFIKKGISTKERIQSYDTNDIKKRTKPIDFIKKPIKIKPISTFEVREYHLKKELGMWVNQLVKNKKMAEYFIIYLYFYTSNTTIFDSHYPFQKWLRLNNNYFPFYSVIFVPNKNYILSCIYWIKEIKHIEKIILIEDIITKLNQMKYQQIKIFTDFIIKNNIILPKKQKKILTEIIINNPLIEDKNKIELIEQLDDCMIFYVEYLTKYSEQVSIVDDKNKMLVEKKNKYNQLVNNSAKLYFISEKFKIIYHYHTRMHPIFISLNKNEKYYKCLLFNHFQYEDVSKQFQKTLTEIYSNDEYDLLFNILKKNYTKKQVIEIYKDIIKNERRSEIFRIVLKESWNMKNEELLYLLYSSTKIKNILRDEDLLYLFNNDCRYILDLLGLKYSYYLLNRFMNNCNQTCYINYAGFEKSKNKWNGNVDELVSNDFICFTKLEKNENTSVYENLFLNLNDNVDYLLMNGYQYCIGCYLYCNRYYLLPRISTHL